MNKFSTPVESVVETVAAFEEVSPLDLPPLVNAVSDETVDRLTDEWADQTEPIEFTYLSYHITVSQSGEVTLGL